MSYYMKVPLGPHMLLFESTLGSSYPTIWRHPWVPMSYYLEVSLGPDMILFEDTFGSSCTIIRRYPYIVMCYSLEVSSGRNVLFTSSDERFRPCLKVSSGGMFIFIITRRL
jgi:hypothetical protein